MQIPADRWHATSTRQAASALLLCLLLAAWPTGCQVQLISQYDPQTDAAATDLQQKLESFLLEMEAASESDLPEDVARRSYQANRAFYREVEVAISSMQLRAEAIPQNELTIAQIGLLRDSVESLKQVHIEAGDRGLRRVVALPARQGLNAHLGAIIRLELAKRRGEE